MVWFETICKIIIKTNDILQARRLHCQTGILTTMSNSSPTTACHRVVSAISASLDKSDINTSSSQSSTQQTIQNNTTVKDKCCRSRTNAWLPSLLNDEINYEIDYSTFS